MRWGGFGDGQQQPGAAGWGDQGRGRRGGMPGSAAQVYSGQSGAAGGSTSTPSAPAETDGASQPSWGGEQRSGGGARQVYGQPSSILNASGQFAGGSWDMGEQGAEGAWSNGYNPHQVTQAPPAVSPRAQASAAAPASAPPPAAPPTTIFGADGRPLVDFTPNPRGQGGFGDARDNPNNTMSMFYDPANKQGDVSGYYYDFDNPALRANQAGQLVGKDRWSTWSPTMPGAGPGADQALADYLQRTGQS